MTTQNNTKKFTEATIYEALEDNKLACIKLEAPWCAPCRQMDPIVDEIAKKYDGKVLVGKVNIDETPYFFEKQQVKSIPTLLFFQNGQRIDALTLIGLKSISEVAKNIDDLIDTPIEL